MNVRTACRTIRRFLLDQSGPTSTEYAVLLALILIAVLASITTVGVNLNNRYVQIDATIFP